MESPPLRSRTRHKTLAYGVAGDDMKQMRRDCGAQVSQEQIDQDELYYEVTTNITTIYNNDKMQWKYSVVLRQIFRKL